MQLEMNTRDQFFIEIILKFHPKILKIFIAKNHFIVEIGTVKKDKRFQLEQKIIWRKLWTI